MSWNDADNNLVLSTGDSFSLGFEMCFLPDADVTLDGTKLIDDIVITGDPINEIAPWRFAATFNYDELSAADSEDTASITGDIGLDLNSEDGIVVNASVSSTSLVTSINNENETLSGYLLTESTDLNTQTQTISADGTYTSTVLDGSITFETREAFVVIGDDNPSSGVIYIADNQSSVLVTVLDNVQVQLEIDFDLDMSIDRTIVVTWDSLDID